MVRAALLVLGLLVPPGRGWSSASSTKGACGAERPCRGPLERPDGRAGCWPGGRSWRTSWERGRRSAGGGSEARVVGASRLLRWGPGGPAGNPAGGNAGRREGRDLLAEGGVGVRGDGLQVSAARSGSSVGALRAPAGDSGASEVEPEAEGAGALGERPPDGVAGRAGGGRSGLGGRSSGGWAGRNWRYFSTWSRT
jgi:hypothetical protein